jgi:hypothetical protein
MRSRAFSAPVPQFNPGSISSISNPMRTVRETRCAPLAGSPTSPRRNLYFWESQSLSNPIASIYADTYFLSQVLHTNNSGVRIVSIGSSRLFLRGATAQSRGDMVVDDFPMLPLLAEWTAGQMQSAFTKRIFANDDAQGTYFAAIDLFAPPDVGGKAFRFYPEYSAPDWGKKAEPPIQRPPMFLTTLGSDAPWPMEMYDESLGHLLRKAAVGAWRCHSFFSITDAAPFLTGGSAELLQSSPTSGFFSSSLLRSQWLLTAFASAMPIL